MSEPIFDPETGTYFDPATETYTGTADPKYLDPEYQPPVPTLVEALDMAYHVGRPATSPALPKTATPREAQTPTEQDVERRELDRQRRADHAADVERLAAGATSDSFESRIRDMQASDRRRETPRQLSERYGDNR
ncbi:MAG: hypothetical protein M3Q10_08270 [Chloroflexota bacterium]|nr:hypothetical protein [Chloroflexota bacterium]